LALTSVTAWTPTVLAKHNTQPPQVDTATFRNGANVVLPHPFCFPDTQQENGVLVT